jgi:hypothetical protein
MHIFARDSEAFNFVVDLETRWRSEHIVMACFNATSSTRVAARAREPVNDADVRECGLARSVAVVYPSKRSTGANRVAKRRVSRSP